MSTAFSFSAIQNHTLAHSYPSAPSYVTFQRSLPSVSASYAAINERTTHTTTYSCPNKSSYYQILGVQQGATSKEIKAAYRSLARTLHPDVVTTSSSSSSEFIRVNQAYSTLLDPVKRALYDHQIMLFFHSSNSTRPSPPSSSSSSSSSLSGYPRRTWETDQCW